MAEQVNHPKHYASATQETRHILKALCVNENFFDVECIEVIELYKDQDNLFHWGSAVKYLWRAGEKGSFVEDLQKARWYCDRIINISSVGKYQKARCENAITLIDQLLADEGEG